MRTCEFCMYAGDECFLLEEPIEYDPSGMTLKENCPMRREYGDLQIQTDGRQDVGTVDAPDR